MKSKMKHTIWLSVFALTLGSFGVDAQTQSKTIATGFNPNPYTAKETAGDATDYSDLEAEDVVFQKTIWRMLDMENECNAPMFYPIRPVGDKENLISLLLEGIHSGVITAYQPTQLGNEFQETLRMTSVQVDRAMGMLSDSISVLDENGNRVWVTREQDSQVDEIQKILVKEMVYFDKKNSSMRTRVIGVCPIRMVPKEGVDDEESELIPQQTFWVAIAQTRDLLANQYVTTGENEARNMTFEAYLTQHRYEGPIYAISNARGNQRLADYVDEAEVEQESMRLDSMILKFEQQIWK